MRGRLYVLRHTYIRTAENHPLLDEGKIVVNHPLIDEGKIMVKCLYRYENLQETIESIFNELNLTGNPQLPRAKSNLRTDKRPYKDLLDSSQKNKIERIFAQEIEWGKYQF